ncbi:glycosyltransferase family 2 protein [Microvirga terrae]|uniref:Glycosyltransferase family 2 protein n=1 Tax=Microvirga terrae TaxID=2740529 RepID=A0ABY5RNQ8_9HYPH|nr:glycosyltransferase family 2 protein [Microvirga terrae]UVF18422.1 glycosyltransferase family 2 protein [Microvirga terrae]
MTDLTRTWLVVPAFNEAQNETITLTVRSAHRIFPNIIVVDDCSSDNTGELALREGAHVCRHPLNLGQGAALATGIRYALGQGAEEIVTFDADGQHSIADAEAMVCMLRAKKVDVVIGSRFIRGTTNVPRGKRLLLMAATAFTRLSTGLQITDTHNGLRVLSRSAAMTITIKQNRMAHASEILNQISDLNLSYAEAPTDISYTKYSINKGQKLSGAITIIQDLLLGRLYK